MTAASNVIVFRPRSADAPLRRPATLIRAAREGQRGWKRGRDLAALLRLDGCPPPGRCLPRLRAEEAMQNELRLARAAEYDMQRHVLLVVAILSEMRAAIDSLPAQRLAL